MISLLDHEISTCLSCRAIRTYSSASFNMCLVDCKSWSHPTIHDTVLYQQGLRHLSQPSPLSSDVFLFNILLCFFIVSGHCSWEIISDRILWNYQLSVCRNTCMPKPSSPIVFLKYLAHKTSYTGTYLWEKSSQEIMISSFSRSRMIVIDIRSEQWQCFWLYQRVKWRNSVSRFHGVASVPHGTKNSIIFYEAQLSGDNSCHGRCGRAWTMHDATECYLSTGSAPPSFHRWHLTHCLIVLVQALSGVSWPISGAWTWYIWTYNLCKITSHWQCRHFSCL